MWILHMLPITVLWLSIYQVVSYGNLYPIGVSNRSIIPDDRFTASSKYSFSSNPHTARLNGDGGWGRETNDDPNDYLQIDLGEVYVIHALATQGHAIMYAYTTEYKISTSTDNNNWTMYQIGGKVKLFPGNEDNNNVKTNVLDSPVDVRFIRFIPTTYKWNKALRVEVYGLKKLDIRLTGGWTPNQGYIEVKTHGKWGKIYSRHWTTKESRVACKMLGMTGKASPWSPPVIAELPTILSLESCQGNEASLLYCKPAGDTVQKVSSTFYIRGVSCGHPTVNVQSKRKNPLVTNKTSDSWIQLYLQRHVYIDIVTLNRSCHAKSNKGYQILPVVSLYDTNSGKSIQCKVTMDTGNEQIAKCDVEFKVNVVRVRSSEKNTTLTMCSQPDVSAYDNFTNIHGVLYDLWNKYITSSNSSILKFNEVFCGPPNISSISPSFSIAAFSGMSNYSLRQQGYLMVGTPGLYLISASCDDECEIWLRRAGEPGLSDNLRADHELLIKIESPTYPTRYKLSRSQYKFQKFSICHLYHMEAYMRQRVNNDYLTVVLKLPDEQGMPLFPTEFLYWMRPGSRVLKFQLTNKISRKIVLGSELTFEAVYEFCCKGLVCPSCPLVLQLDAFERTILVNRRLEMSCEEHKVKQNISTVVQPGNYSIKLLYHFPGDITHWKGERRIVKSIQVSDATRLQCTFDNGICPGWIVSSPNSTSCRWSLEKESFIVLTTPGMSSLESPSMPWNSDYEHISLCLQFSYLLPSNTTSRLEVFSKTTLSKDLLWLLTGDHGVVWGRGRIPFKPKKIFQISFKGYSKTNGSISVALRDVQVISRSCTLRPVFAMPGFQCKVTEFKCGNGQCISKHHRCNDIHGDCLDDSDEDGCICQTGYFTCANQKCILHTRLCDGKTDCPDGEDEHHCGQKCPKHAYQCLNGTCSSCGQQMSCEEKLHQKSCDFLVEMPKDKLCQMQVQRGVCIFDNELCGFENNTSGTLVWDFFTPADYQTKKHNFPNHDHSSMTDKESYILLKSSKSIKNGYGRLVKHWNTTVTACMQFWYFIPDASNSQLEIVLHTTTSTNLLWNTSNPTAGEWAFGQVEIPGNLSGEIILTGYVNRHFVSLDDLGFVRGGCASVYSQRNPSCYEDGKGECSWAKLSPLIRPKREGWRCLRFWFYSGGEYFGREFVVEIKTKKRSIDELTYRSATDKWTFIQLPIPEERERLQIRIRGRKNHPNAILTVNGSTFLKEPCRKIQAHQECHDYKTLSYSDRRHDTIAEDETFQGCDDHLSTTAWYRVVDSAGRQLARSCIDRKSSCSTKYMGWINGLLPSVEDGVVERQLCFASGDKCCVKETIVKIRNCKEYFVYQFPRRVPTCPSKYCTVYKQEWGNNRIGVSDRNVIPDDRFTATSHLSTSWRSAYARLNKKNLAWVPKTNTDPNDYLQIDLAAVFVIYAVSTQGSSKWYIWTTEYKISTSIDNSTWTMYQSGGKVKLFSGNKDGNSVVKNALEDIRTLARFIRFLPTKYHVYKALRVEVYGYRKDLKSLDSKNQNEWEDWVKGRDEIVQWEVLDTNYFEKVANSIKESRRVQGDNLTQDYEADIGFSLGHKNHSVSIEINETLEEMTMCLWMSINNSSSINMNVSYVKENKVKNNIAFLEIDNITRNGTSKWIHICVTWMSNFGVWQTYIDGAAIDIGPGVLDQKELYRGNRISVNFDSQDQKIEVKYSRLNIWKNVLSQQYILYMSYKCGTETGSLLGWKEYLNLLPRNSGGFRIHESTCRGKQGNVMSLIGASSPETPTSLARIESPRYERSSKSPGRCLKFKYKMWGPGTKVLIIYQEFDNKEYSKRPIWMVKDSEDSRWRDGQVTLTAVTEYKLAIEGEITNKPGLMSIGALHTNEGYCNDVVPPSAKEACNEVLTNNTGYIVSPYYPGYYDNNARCTWTIKASKGHLIRLELRAFEMELSPRCSADFVEVYDGGEALSTFRIGRYCGTRYPEIIQSQSDTIKILFTSNNNVTRSGFKAYYQIIKDTEDDDCVQDCPFSCTCRREANGSGIIITNYNIYEFLSIPGRLPKNTKAIVFSGSNIYQVKSNAFIQLNYLSLIDLSFNRIFVVEEMSFVNLPSLKTLRLNRNFIKEVLKNMFSGLVHLETIDLGENLISNISLDAFSGFPSLRALSLRSNQIQSLHGLTFQNTTNLTYLYLQDNQLKRIPAGMFRQQKYLEILLLHQNKIERIDKSSFEGLENLRKLSLRNNSINEQTTPEDVFKNLQKLEYLSTDSFIICCYATTSIPNLNCESPGNEFSSCDDMLKNILVKICIWAEGVLATFGNLAVISWWIFFSTKRRKTKTKINSVQSLLFCHLAFADLLMGVYLLLIGTYNEIWKGEYFLHDVEWRAGDKCRIAGAIATLSSEVSVMILVAITADRMNTILFPVSGRRTNLKVAHVLSLFIWVIGIIMSFAPLLIPSYFNDKVSGFSFYGRSTVCLPLQLSTDRPAGWEYSVAVFIAVNGAAFFFILVGYIAIFTKVRESAQNVRSSSSSDSALTKRIIFVILTDFFCWMPVMVLGVLSLVYDFNQPSVYVWVAVFVLPVNSAINPILYTFSSSQTINSMKSIRKRLMKNTENNRLEDDLPRRRRRMHRQSSPEEITLTVLKTNQETANKVKE